MAVLYTRIVERRDTAANWTSEDPTLAAGEIGVELGTGLFKIGDGSTSWTGLPYAGGAGAFFQALGTRSTPIDVSEPIASPTFFETLLFAKGDSGPVTIDNIGAPPAVGGKLRLQVASADTVTLSASGNIQVNGGSVTLGMQAPLPSVINLHYDGLKWVEDSRNGI